MKPTGSDREQKGNNKNKKNSKHPVLKEILSYAFYIGLAIVLALLWKTFVFTKVEVISGSMMDTLQVGDRLIASKMPYIFGEVQRGDIMVFHFPDDENEIYIKRVIGLPGETVEIINGYVYIDGVLLEEDYVRGERYGNYGPYLVPQGEYFMLGDNRLNSEDSRAWKDKYVSKSQIVGKALFRYKPKFEKIYSED